MQAESKELYFYTKDQFIEKLEKISPDCVSPIIVVRQVVKKAIDKYCLNYCTNNEIPFSEEDFQSVSWKIYEEIMNNEL